MDVVTRLGLATEDVDPCLRGVFMMTCKGDTCDAPCDLLKIRDCMRSVMTKIVGTLAKLNGHFLQMRDMTAVLMISYYIDYYLWFLVYTCFRYNAIYRP